MNKIYDINDFFGNSQNKLFKVKEITFNKKNEYQLIEKYLIITDTNILICSSINIYNKTRIQIEFYAFILTIKNINDFYTEGKNKEQLNCIDFTWEKNAPFKYDNTLCIQPEEKKDLIDNINQRKSRLESKFDLIMDDDIEDLEALKKIADVKEKIYNKYKDEYSFSTLSKVYQKIIELYSVKNNEEFLPYMKKLKELITNFDNMEKEKKMKK